MEDYNKIIESLGISYMNARNIVTRKNVCISNFKDVGNAIVINHKGKFFFDDLEIKEGDAIFIPGGKTANICFGEKGSEIISNDKFATRVDEFFKINTQSDTFGNIPNNYSIINFEAKIFDAVSYFTSLDIPPFKVESSKNISNLAILLLKELNKNKVGKERVVNSLTDQIAVEVIRYIVENQLFLEQLATNTTYFKDPRLIDIFKFIKDNLSGDLSNKTLANVANVSEDYVGQYFKMLTGINPQDYIEYQRMEKAVVLLRTSKTSIREIGRDVGYKDTAYFCRRFKMMFGIPAGKMRRRENTSI